MARIARIVVPGVPHHIVQRGNRRQLVFFSDEDRSYYLELLGMNSKKYGLVIWAYCLMDNHVHIVALPKNESALAYAIGDTHRAYTRHVNFRENWRGYLWQGRFSSAPMDRRHLYAAVRYVERNPVRAGMVTLAEQYRWSSARAHVLNEPDGCLSGAERTIMGIENWRLYLSCLDDDSYLEILRKHSRTGRPLGDNRFMDTLESITGRSLKPSTPGRKKRK